MLKRKLVIPVTLRLKGYTTFVEKHVTGKCKRLQPYIYIFLPRNTTIQDLGNQKS